MPEHLTPVKRIRLKCLDCCCWQRAEVRLCPATHCALWPYRMGRRPAAEDAILGENLPASPLVHDEESQKGAMTL